MAPPPPLFLRQLVPVALVVAGCQTPPAVVPAPEVETEAQDFPGSWLGQRRPEAVPCAPGQAWQVLVRCSHLQVLPAMTGLPPAIGLAELVTVEPTRHLFLPTSRFLADVRVATFDLPDARAPLGAVAAAALPFATTELAVRWRRLCEPGRSAGTLAARIDRSGEQAHLVLVASDGGQVREAVLLRRHFAPGDSLRLCVPLGDGGDGLLLEWELHEPPTGQPAADAHRLLAEIAGRRLASITATASKEPELSSQAGRVATLASQVESTAELGQSRSALRALSQSVGAVLAEDVATVADQQAIEQVTSAVRANAGPAPTVESLAFLLEQSSLLLLIERLELEQLTPITDALLLTRTGALGRFPERLREALARATDLPSLDAVLLEENQSLLRDANPSHRVRAFDWLRRRQAAPDGFDPLGSPADRRSALARMGR